MLVKKSPRYLRLEKKQDEWCVNFKDRFLSYPVVDELNFPLKINSEKILVKIVPADKKFSEKKITTIFITNELGNYSIWIDCIPTKTIHSDRFFSCQKRGKYCDIVPVNKKTDLFLLEINLPIEFTKQKYYIIPID